MRAQRSGELKVQGGKRSIFIAILVLIVLASIAALVASRAGEASPKQLANRLLLFILWYLDLSLIAVLFFVLVRNFVKLAVERRAGIIGSRFRSRLVASYALLTLLPVLLIFMVATNLLQRSIERWFSSPVEEILKGGAELASEVRELLESRLVRQAAVATDLLREGWDLERLMDTLGVDVVEVYRRGLRVRAVARPDTVQKVPPRLTPAQIAVATSRADRWRGALLIRAWSSAGGETVVVGVVLPNRVLTHLEMATAAHSAFQEMKLKRGTVTSTTVLVLLAVTLIVLFGAVWVGLYLSRRFTQPLMAVVEATRRVAEGDRLEEVDVAGTDEVAALVASFNAMVRRVRATQDQLESYNQEMRTLLAALPTGVLTLSEEKDRFKANPAALRILGLDVTGEGWHSVDVLNRPGLAPLVEMLGREGELPDHAEIELRSGGRTRVLEVMARRLPRSGWVVVLEDLTQLVRAQRQAAWSEVARRIAHEIKNPLTPIRLAAERIASRTAEMPSDMADVVGRSCDAIVAHVSGLKDLVDAFHRYARMPLANPQPVKIEELVGGVVELYRGLKEGVEVSMRVDEGCCPTAFVDPVLFRQALVNLVDNAVEAVGSEGRVDVLVRVEDGWLCVEVLDDGCGLPTEELDKLVQPFFSTKGRGSGMGLALVHRIVSDHGGLLELKRRAPKGTVARIKLPVQQ